MKTFFLLLIAVLSFSLISHAQDKPVKKIPAHAWVTLTMDGQAMKGELLKLKAESVLFKKYKPDAAGAYPYETVEYAVAQIEKIQVRSKRSVQQGSLIGLGIGALAGIILGFASGDDESGMVRFNAESKAALGGISLGIGGAILGAIAGTARRSFPIKGR